MRDFSYLRAGSVDEARRAAALPATMLLAGGTTLLDLAKSASPNLTGLSTSCI